MMKLRRGRGAGVIVLALVVVLALAACGGGESEEGVQLEVAGDDVQPTATPQPTPTNAPSAPDAAGDDIPLPDDLSGRLLVLRGGRFELVDLARDETTVFEGAPRAYSPANPNRAQTAAAYSAFPNFAVIDLVDPAVQMIQSGGSNPTGFVVSPDGQWLATFTGQITRRLQVLAVDGSVMHNVAASSQATFNTAWTQESQLIWWQVSGEMPEFQRFDPMTGESVPVTDLDITVQPPGALSPDGTRVASVPIAAQQGGAAGAGDDASAAACFDSYVELHTGPFTLASETTSETLWTETGLVAASPQWLDEQRVLFVKLGTGECGAVQGDPARMVMLLDTSEAAPDPVEVAGPLGNADDVNDRPQGFGAYGHLYSASPDGRYIAWIDGGLDAGESMIMITEIATGNTSVLQRMTRDEAADVADFIENYLFRQVVWLE